MKTQQTFQSLAAAGKLVDHEKSHNGKFSVDNNGNIYRDKSRPENTKLMRFFHRKDLSAAKAIREKLAAELNFTTGMGEDACRQYVKNKIPLTNIQKHIDRRDLLEFSRKTILTLTQKKYKKYSGQIDQFKMCLPIPLAAKFNPEKGFYAHQAFSEDAKTRILDDFKTLQKDLADPAQMGEDGIHKQTSQDATRANFSFGLRNGLTSYNLGDGDNNVRAEGVKNGIKELARGNVTVQKALSTLINQRALAAQIIATKLDFPPKNGIPYQFTYQSPANQSKASQAINYAIDPGPGDTFIVKLDFFQGGDTIQIDDQSFPITAGLNPSKPVGKDNFALKSSVSLILKRSDLENGEIKPAFFEEPTVTFQFRPVLQTPKAS